MDLEPDARFLGNVALGGHSFSTAAAK